MDSNVSLADIAAVTKDQDGVFGAGGGLWVLIILLFLMGGSGFGWGNSQAGRVATVEDLNNQSNFTRLESQVAANGALTERKIDAVQQGLCSLGYETAEKFGAVNTAIAESTASIKEMMYQNKIEALQQQLNAVQLQSALCGVVRYPTTMAYNAGTSPFCPNTCCGTTTNI